LPGQQLEAPFIVQLKDSSGNPLANAAVTFSVLTGNGTLTSSALDPELNASLQVTTDINGNASVYFTEPTKGNFTSNMSVQAGGQTQSFTSNTTSFSPKITAAGQGALVLNDGGVLQTWGNGSTVPTPVTDSVGAPISMVTAIATGDAHNLAVENDGTVLAWGDNDNGQLGNGTTDYVSGVVQVTPLVNITAVAAGNAHSVALTQDGHVWAWGSNSSGQLGNGTTTDSYVPVQVNGLCNVIAISARENYTLALKSDHTVWAWGDNSYNQLADGNGTNSSVPVQITGLTGIVSLSAGDVSALALDSSGSVWSWGDNEYGELGDGDIDENEGLVHVSGLTASSVCAGKDCSYAVKTDGTVWAWGRNYAGQLGNNSTADSHVPTQVTPFTNTDGTVAMISVAATEDSAVALGSDGTVWTWGAYFSNSEETNNGELANFSLEGSLTPLMVPLRLTTLESDSNSNGIPDSWEVEYFYGLIPYAYAGAYNGDYTCIRDYQLGLSPLSSILQPIQNVTATAVTGGVEITWTVPPGDPTTSLAVEQEDSGHPDSQSRELFPFLGGRNNDAAARTYRH
jgi:alpha-tubulin suppressor-like RCC1 family protein